MGMEAPRAPIPPQQKIKLLNTNINKIMETTEQVEKTVISFSKPTPNWATWIFRIILWAGGFVLYTFCSDRRIPAETRVDIALYCTGIVQLVHIITRAIGVKIEDESFKTK